MVVAVGLVVVLALVVGLVGWRAVHRPFPTYDGERALPGLSAPVTVHRDRYGIPHIYAETAADLFRAQGYVHAQDRFWEMDLRRFRQRASRAPPRSAAPPAGRLP